MSPCPLPMTTGRGSWPTAMATKEQPTMANQTCPNWGCVRGQSGNNRSAPTGAGARGHLGNDRLPRPGLHAS
eukprot:10030124-Alexandrium_andersonii.AAC.1